MSYTEEELNMLSEEERAAIADSSPEAERDLLEAVAGDEGDGEEQGDEGDGEEQGDEGDGEEQGDEVGEQPDGIERPDFVPKYHAPAIEDYDAKLTELDSKFESGDIVLKDYNRQRDELVRAQTKAEISVEQNAQVQEQMWQRDIADFLDDHKEYGNKFRHVALDLAVKDLAADEANNDKTGRWFLREAHKIVQKEFGAQVVDKKDEQETPPTKPGNRKPDLSVVPKTLAHLPAAELPETGSVDEFAHLDRLTGLELENAVSRLSAAERERYRAA